MCQICEARQNNRVGEFVNLTRLNCSNCPLLTSIPDTLVNLTHLHCYNCPLLSSIPNSLVNLYYLDCDKCPLVASIPDTLADLTFLYCSNCPLLTSIPDTLVNLATLVCVYCPLLTSIPDTLVNLTALYCSNCPLLTSVPVATAYCYGCYWLPQNDPMPPSRAARVTVIQRWARRSRKGRLLSRWIKTRGFNEWFYAPKGIGGSMHIRKLSKFLETARNVPLESPSEPQ